jgi:hypothetical protein
MIPHRVQARDADLSWIGRLVAHSVRDDAGRRFVLHKGETIGREHLAALEELGDRELHLLEVEPGEIHETEAAARVARAIGPVGMGLRGPSASQFTIVAEHRGLLRVDDEALFAVNSRDGISCQARFDWQPVDATEPVCSVKVTPFAMPERVIEEIERYCDERPPLRLLPFRRRRVAAIVLERVDNRQRERFEEAIVQKMTWFGSDLIAVRETRDRSEYLPAMQELLEMRPDLILAAGASSIDPLEPIFGVLDSLGARLLKHGVPVHPGSLLWVAHVGSVPMYGLSSSEMFSHKTVLDLLLPRVMAGEPITRDDLVRLGHGGMLTREMAYRFPSYQPSAISFQPSGDGGPPP